MALVADNYALPKTVWELSAMSPLATAPTDIEIHIKSLAAEAIEAWLQAVPRT
jgi:hypothetical protein